MIPIYKSSASGRYLLFIVASIVRINRQVLGQNASLTTTTNSTNRTPTSAPTLSECVFEPGKNEALFRNSTMQGYATIYGNDTLILPAPSTTRIVEYVVDVPVHGTLRFNDTDFSFMYEPDPTFVGTDLFAIDQCLYKSTDDYSPDKICDCRYFDVVINILPVPISSNEIGSTDIDTTEVATPSNDDGSMAIYALAILALLPICCLISYCFWKNDSTDVVDETKRDFDDSANEQPQQMNDSPIDHYDDSLKSVDDEKCTPISGLHTTTGISIGGPNQHFLQQQRQQQQQDVEHHPLDMNAGGTISVPTTATTSLQ